MQFAKILPIFEVLMLTKTEEAKQNVWVNLFFANFWSFDVEEAKQNVWVNLLSSLKCKDIKN